MKWQSFACEAEPLPPNAPAASRPSERSRLLDLAAPYHPPSLQFFDCEMLDFPDGALAIPRPKGKERHLPMAEADIDQRDVEQKVVSILLDPNPVAGEKTPTKAEYFREYLSEGWRIKQLASISTGGTYGWIIVLLERERNPAMASHGNKITPALGREK